MAGRSDIVGLTVQKYQEIIDGVVGRVKPSFNEEGIDESVLDEVRALWEAKLVATGVVGEPSNEGAQVIQSHSMMPRPGGWGPGALPLGIQQQQLQQAQAQYMAMRPGFHPGMAQGMQMMQQMPGGAPNMNMAYAMMQAQAQAQAAAAEQKRKLDLGAAGPSGQPAAKTQRTIPQQDGPADDAAAGGEEAGGEDAAAAESGAAAAAEEEDDDPLTEDDGEGSGDDVDEAAVTNVVLGQFEKVQRSKNKWKVVLKDCILTLDGRDYLLRRCTGEMEF
ncbi:hypothetical protein D9Q98_003782 [Chlorella vulgaris]|uniref:Uncharacterized protein n=1 Tax=Chlorella vulgaris TaxID=3077 RepID=A0A9D4YXR9_CHLVU|nr:hypothetical protein D9Q98_003782 [Chlorella vulgaris]